MNLKIHPTYLEDLCIIQLMYLEVRDSSDVPKRFMNLYIMVFMVAIMNDLLAFLDNGHYDCFMITIMKDLSVFLDNGHYGCFMVTIMKDFSVLLDTCIRSL